MEKYKKLEAKAIKAFGTLDGVCSEIFWYIEEMVDLPDWDTAHVFIQDGDGLVLSWESAERNAVVNTPVDHIITNYRITREPLTEDELLNISI